MDIVQYTGPAPLLRRPVLLAAFHGWNDAGECGTSAVETVETVVGATPFAEIDPEEFFDFQVARPLALQMPGGERRLEWPTNLLSWGSLPGVDRDVVTLLGTEPNLRWRTFVGAVVDTAHRLDVELAVTLGALQVDGPHTRPAPLSGRSNTPDLAERIGLRQSGYEGPTGITGVLYQSFADAGLPAVSLWAGVPHYLAGASYAAGTLTLADAVSRLLETDLGLEELSRDALAQREEIADLVAEDEDLARYVADLEARVDADSGSIQVGEGDLPKPDVSGDELAAELERYLRDRDH